MRALLVMVLVFGFSPVSVAVADEAGVCIGVGLGEVEADCKWTYAGYQLASSSDPGHVWAVVPLCEDPLIHSCWAQLACEVGGEEGRNNYVFRDGENLGIVCIPVSVAESGPGHSDVVKEFRRLSWPRSRVVVRPPGGRTLVNLATIFFTSNSSVSSRTVSLADRSVLIEATPVKYAWSFGDGESAVTSSPGHAYPDQDVTHVYGATGRVEAAVATTYRGRYRIGNRDWVDIEETLTVAGPEVELNIVEARPQLVIQ